MPSKKKSVPVPWDLKEGDDNYLKEPWILKKGKEFITIETNNCLLYTSPSPRDQRGSRMPSSA